MASTIYAAAAHSVNAANESEWAKAPDLPIQAASTIKTLTCWAARHVLTDMAAPTTLLERDMLWSEPLLLGDRLSMGDMIHAAMMQSINCAAENIARVAGEAIIARDGGSGDPRARFLTEASRLATDELGWTGHRINDPAGNNADNRLTVRGLTTLMHRVRLDDPWLYDAMSKTSHVIPVTGARTTNVNVVHTIGPVPRATSLSGFVAGKSGTQGNGDAAPRYLVWSWRDPRGDLHTAALADSDGPHRNADARAVMDDVIAALPPIEHPEPSPDAGAAMLLAFFLQPQP